MYRNCALSCALRAQPSREATESSRHCRCDATLQHDASLERSAEERLTEARASRFDELQVALREEAAAELWQQQRVHKGELEQCETEAREQQAILVGQLRVAERRAAAVEAQLERLRSGEERGLWERRIAVLARDLEHTETERLEVGRLLEEARTKASRLEERLRAEAAARARTTATSRRLSRRGGQRGPPDLRPTREVEEVRSCDGQVSEWRSSTLLAAEVWFFVVGSLEMAVALCLVKSRC